MAKINERLNKREWTLGLATTALRRHRDPLDHRRRRTMEPISRSPQSWLRAARVVTSATQCQRQLNHWDLEAQDSKQMSSKLSMTIRETLPRRAMSIYNSLLHSISLEEVQLPESIYNHFTTRHRKEHLININLNRKEQGLVKL